MAYLGKWSETRSFRCSSFTRLTPSCTSRRRRAPTVGRRTRQHRGSAPVHPRFHRPLPTRLMVLSRTRRETGTTDRPARAVQSLALGEGVLAARGDRAIQDLLWAWCGYRSQLHHHRQIVTDGPTVGDESFPHSEHEGAVPTEGTLGHVEASEWSSWPVEPSGPELDDILAFCHRDDLIPLADPPSRLAVCHQATYALDSLRHRGAEGVGDH